MQIIVSRQVDTVQAHHWDEFQEFNKRENRRQEQQMYNIRVQEKKISGFQKRRIGCRVPSQTLENVKQSYNLDWRQTTSWFRLWAGPNDLDSI